MSLKSFLDINWIYTNLYGDNVKLLENVYTHSSKVAQKALKIADEKKLDLDRKIIYCAAMLHDIGVVKCYAPDINANGPLPYIQHGVEGQKILQLYGLTMFDKVCERHTGSGITAIEIKQQQLPLPHRDLLPVSLLEKLICYADKFYSKGGDLEREKSIPEIEKQLERFGESSLKRFKELHQLFNS